MNKRPVEELCNHEARVAPGPVGGPPAAARHAAPIGTNHAAPFGVEHINSLSLF
jgi:hypothetical protein